MDAGEDGSIALGIVAGLSAAQFHYQIEEVFRLIAFEGHHEFLVIEPERIRGVEAYGGILVPDFNVLVHHALARRMGEPVPGTRLDERVDKQIAEFSRSQA